MLWKKESKKKNALYRDISKFDKDEDLEFLLTSNSESLPKKNDAVALMKRRNGNDLFGKRQWIKAIEKYNESLCYATPGSEHISLAYANRSTAFLHLKMYDRCLKDIELAKKAGYPANLMSKLDQREAECLKQSEEAPKTVNIDIKLSYEPNEQFPSLSNNLEVITDANGKRKVVAKGDIDVGHTIMVDKSFVSYLLTEFGSKCNICLKEQANLVPCKTCTRAMFCSDECQENPLHKLECGLKLCDHDLMNSMGLKEVRILLMAINMFETAEDLMNFVEETRQTGPNELPSTMADDRSKYRAFLKQKTCMDCFGPDDLASNIYPTYTGLLKIPQIRAKFGSLKHRRFLMHLIAYHGLMGCHGECCNRTLNPYQPQSSKIIDPIDFYYQLNNIQVGLMTNYFTHSSTPNMLSVRGNGKQAGVVVRPIKKGDEILNSCVPVSYGSVKGPRMSLDEVAQHLSLKLDSNYKDLVDNFESRTKENTPKLIGNCVEFLREHGQHQLYQQVLDVTNMYGSLLRDQLMS